MFHELISIDCSYFEHLKLRGIQKVLALRYEAGKENEQDLRDCLVEILTRFPTGNGKWLISSLGPLEPYKNLAVLNTIAAHEAQVAFYLPEVYRPDGLVPLAFAELSFEWLPTISSLLMPNPGTSFGWDLCFGGWLVPVESWRDFIKQPKFQNSFQYPAENSILGFCSSPDWDALEFFSTDVSELVRLQTFVESLRIR